MLKPLRAVQRRQLDNTVDCRDAQRRALQGAGTVGGQSRGGAAGGAACPNWRFHKFTTLNPNERTRKIKLQGS